MSVTNATGTTTASGELPWQTELARAVRDPAELLRCLELPPDLLDAAERGARLFPLRVPRPYLGRIRPGDPHDPLLRQVLPLAAEARRLPGFTGDPLQEKAQCSGSGVLHKYAGRALVVATGACAINCRYCFRRAFPYTDHAGWRPALEYLERHGAPEEIVLSGGDPLLLDDTALAAFIRRLEQLNGVKRLRIHTRLPVVIPTRATPALTELLGSSRLQNILVLHINHPREIDTKVVAALTRLRPACSALLNQAVLLRGVNADVTTLAQLSEQLFAAGVLPYYLHLLDPVEGAAHFDVDEKTGRQLWSALHHRLPGYLVPRLAREEPGTAAKRIIA